MICNACRANFFSKDPGAFLCRSREKHAPDAQMQEYRDTVREISRLRSDFKREEGRFPMVGEIDEEMIEKAVVLWRSIGEAVRRERKS